MTKTEEFELIAGGEYSEVTHTSTVADLLEQDDPLLVRLRKPRPDAGRTADT